MPMVLFAFFRGSSPKAVWVSQQGIGHDQVSGFCLQDFKAKRVCHNHFIRPPSGKQCREMAATASFVLSSHQ